MQQPDHDIKIVSTSQATPRRVISLALVGLFHLVLVYALVSGLAQTLIQKLPEEFKVATVQDKPDVKPPPPPPPPLEEPPPPFVPPPDIVISSEPATNAIQSQSTQPQAPPAPVPPSVGKSASPRGSRRGCVDLYPAMSQRLKEEGVTQVHFTITADGNVTNASVSQASGSERLDAAALSCIVRWHWNPAQNAQGQPMETQTALNIKWQLPK